MIARVWAAIGRVPMYRIVLYALAVLLANGVGIIALVRQQRFDLVGDHPQQRREALDVVCLSARQDEAERAAFGIASGVEFGAEATARSAKRLGFLSPFFMPTAQ